MWTWRKSIPQKSLLKDLPLTIKISNHRGDLRFQNDSFAFLPKAIRLVAKLHPIGCNGRRHKRSHGSVLRNQWRYSVWQRTFGLFDLTKRAHRSRRALGYPMPSPCSKAQRWHKRGVEYESQNYSNLRLQDFFIIIGNSDVICSIF